MPWWGGAGGGGGLCEKDLCHPPPFCGAISVGLWALPLGSPRLQCAGPRELGSNSHADVAQERRLATGVRQVTRDQMEPGPTEVDTGRICFLLSSGGDMSR